MSSVSRIMAALKTVTFPGIDRDIVSLGYVREVREDNGTHVITVSLSTNAEEAGEQIERDCREALDAVEIPYRLEMQIQIHRPHRHTPGSGGGPSQGDPGRSGGPGGPDTASTVEFVDLLESIPCKIAVASGKGGVGKSTVAVNLAIGLAKLGRRTGLLDSDIYGPSIPMMLGMENRQPEIRDHRMLPLERYGVRSISMGYLLDRETPLIWRGPMLGRALEQLIEQVDWDGIDTLVFDLPPGTGDIQISLAQKIRLSGAVIVTTPQDVALIDAARGVRMFGKVSVPILGLVENMSHFACPHCGGRTDIFRSGGGKRESGRLGVPLLGEIPLDPVVALGGDEGTPVLAGEPDSPAALAFMDVARNVAARLGIMPVAP